MPLTAEVLWANVSVACAAPSASSSIDFGLRLSMSVARLVVTRVVRLPGRSAVERRLLGRLFDTHLSHWWRHRLGCLRSKNAW